jgi:hypothetical protein
VKQRAASGALGKDLTRRSHGRCELCEGRVDCRPFEIPPFPPEPEMERTLLACGRCRHWLESGKIEPLEARFLTSAVWTEVPAVRLAAAQLLKSAGVEGDPWIQEALEVLATEVA